MSYQGVLTLPDGTVVEDGLYDLLFEIEKETEEVEWFQQLEVQVEDGLYSVLLTKQGLSDAFRGSPRFMQVTVLNFPDDGAPPIELEPRQEIGSVPYALVSGTGSAGGVDIQSAETTASTLVAKSAGWVTLENSEGTGDFSVSTTVPDAGEHYIKVTALIAIREGDNARASIRLNENDGVSDVARVPVGLDANSSGLYLHTLVWYNPNPENSTTYTFSVQANSAAVDSRFNSPASGSPVSTPTSYLFVETHPKH